MLNEALNRCLEPIPSCFNESRAKHPLHFRFRELRAELQTLIEPRPGYLVNDSIGQGQWAQVPWAAIFDELVTDTAQRGYYVVYLFSNDGTRIFLSLNQATTEAERQFGAGYVQVLETRASEYWKLIHDHGRSDFITGTIDLAASSRLARGYAAGNIAALEYKRDAVPGDDVLLADLQDLLSLYEQLIYKAGVNGIDPANDDASAGESEKTTTGLLLEAQQVRNHVRVERNRKLSEAAKKAHGLTCTVCGFNFEERYGSRGQGYIEAHHLTPISELKGRPTMLDPEADFTVLCANCHRMIHRTIPTIGVDELRDLIRETSSAR
jgi:5-methylcytosine-specific restriction protein A